ncbi:unnamed protein product [Microthlaspi erraticum]|uniref:Uncharacterized protein n=1 Tax=Microthlaspi erraticum TaxID=1685480 RepID=A0A6D2JHU5_9BRAS|nr:unnamed protein product [Microthlaspi erraticum]
MIPKHQQSPLNLSFQVFSSRPILVTQIKPGIAISDWCRPTHSPWCRSTPNKNLNSLSYGCNRGGGGSPVESSAKPNPLRTGSGEASSSLCVPFSFSSSLHSGLTVVDSWRVSLLGGGGEVLESLN